jgi:hypothetical protein
LGDASVQEVADVLRHFQHDEPDRELVEALNDPELLKVTVKAVGWVLRKHRASTKSRERNSRSRKSAREPSAPIEPKATDKALDAKLNAYVAEIMKVETDDWWVTVLTSPNIIPRYRRENVVMWHQAHEDRAVDPKVQEVEKALKLLAGQRVPITLLSFDDLPRTLADFTVAEALARGLTLLLEYCRGQADLSELAEQPIDFWQLVDRCQAIKPEAI